MDSSVTPVRHGGLSLVQTTDFFYPLVDDPYMMGKKVCGKPKREFVKYRRTNKSNFVSDVSLCFFIVAGDAFQVKSRAPMSSVTCMRWVLRNATTC